MKNIDDNNKWLIERIDDGNFDGGVEDDFVSNHMMIWHRVMLLELRELRKLGLMPTLSLIVEDEEGTDLEEEGYQWDDGDDDDFGDLKDEWWLIIVGRSLGILLWSWSMNWLCTNCIYFFSVFFFLSRIWSMIYGRDYKIMGGRCNFPILVLRVIVYK